MKRVKVPFCNFTFKFSSLRLLVLSLVFLWLLNSLYLSNLVWPSEQNRINFVVEKKKVRPSRSTKFFYFTSGVNYFGYHLIKSLSSRGDKVVVIDDLLEEEPIHQVELTYWVEQLKYYNVKILRADPCDFASTIYLYKEFIQEEDDLNFFHFHRRGQSPAEALTCFSEILSFYATLKNNFTFFYDANGFPGHFGQGFEESFKTIADYKSSELKKKIIGVKRGVLFGQGLDSQNNLHHILNNLLKVDDCKTFNSYLCPKVNINEKLIFQHISEAVSAVTNLIDEPFSHSYTQTYRIPSSSNSISASISEILESLKNKIKISQSTAIPIATQMKCLELFSTRKAAIEALLEWFLSVLLKFYKKKENVSLDKSYDKETLKALLNWSLIGGGSGRRVVFACYFFSKTDPQRGRSVAGDSFSYIKRWYESVRRLSLDAVIFHDGLQTDFIGKFQTDKIRFVKVKLGNRSTNDERFFVYQQYLREHLDIKAVFFTDISDVYFRMNPFELVRVIGNRLYIGQDRGQNMRSNLWMKFRFNWCVTEEANKKVLERIQTHKQVYNAGIIGGYTAMILPFLSKVTAYLNKLDKNYNCNMLVVNWIVHLHYNYDVFTGFPLNSLFFEKEQDPQGIFIVHK